LLSPTDERCTSCLIDTIAGYNLTGWATLTHYDKYDIETRQQSSTIQARVERSFAQNLQSHELTREGRLNLLQSTVTWNDGPLERNNWLSKSIEGYFEASM
jgi:hypothetical protein